MTTFGRSLDGSEVVGQDGTNIGEFYDVRYDSRTGELKDLVVTPTAETPERTINYNKDETGRFRVPAGHVKAVNDRIIVSHT